MYHVVQKKDIILKAKQDIGKLLGDGNTMLKLRKGWTETSENNWKWNRKHCSEKSPKKWLLECQKKTTEKNWKQKMI